MNRSKKKLRKRLEETQTKATSVGLTVGVLRLHNQADFYLIQMPSGNVIKTGKLPEINALVDRYCKLKAFL